MLHNHLYQMVIKRLLEVPQTRINTGFLKHFKLFKLAPARNILNSFAYEIWLRLFGLLSLFRRHGLSDFLLPFCCHNKLLHYTFRTRQTENLKCIRSNSCAVIIRFTLLKNGSLVSMGESFASIIAYTTSNSLD